MLYARFRNRRLMTTGLMLAAAATAIFGFFSARKAYWQQTQLAESKSNFVAAVSHELRAPIASIQLLVESLERGTVPTEERRQEYFRLISQECRRLGGLIRNVLDFSRIEQGAKSYARELVDVAALLEHTRAVLAPMAASRAVTLKVIWPEKPLTVWGDGQALQQALLNLIDNALKHSPADSTVTVDVTQMDEAWVEFSVRDEGPGIPLAEQQRIFEPFYRLGSELRRETEGAGIGLAIVRHIMAGHGGTVTVHSEPGNGSRFVLRLPSGEANSSEGAKS